MKRILFVCGLVFVLVATAVAFGGLTFKKLVTDKVIEKAVAEYARGMDSRWPTGGNYTSAYGVLWHGGVEARHAVYENVMGEKWFEKLYYGLDMRNYSANPDYAGSEFEKYDKEQSGDLKAVAQYEEIFAVARKALETPVGLKTAYLSHKKKVVREVWKHTLQERVQSELAFILDYFEGKILAEKPTLREKNTYEWVARRRSEGGQALVDTYVWCIQDLANSL